ncbi:MAG: ankyrin repeat domain-containing protein [Ramlibacter sp.]
MTRTVEDVPLELDPAQVARKMREHLAQTLLTQLCAPADASQWNDALLHAQPELVDIVLGQFLGVHKNMSVALQDDGHAAVHVENGFFDATPLVKLAEALTPHAHGVALKLLAAALSGSHLPGERMKLAEALLRLLARAGAAALPDAQRHALRPGLDALLADPALTWQDKRGFAALLPANAARQAGAVLEDSAEKIRQYKAGNSSAAPQDCESQLAVAFYTGLFTGDQALADRALELLGSCPGDTAARLVQQCSQDRQALAQDIATTAMTATATATTTATTTVTDPSETALHRAAAQGDLQAVDALLRALPPGQIDAVKQNGATALLVAADKGHLDVMKLLLASGANLDARDNQGNTPLYMAVFRGHVSLVKELLKLAARQLDLARKDSFTPLLTAALHGDVEILKLLLDKGANPDIQTKAGSTPLLMGAQGGHTGVIRELLTRAHHQLNQAKKDGSTPLLVAIGHGHPEAAKLLLGEAGIDVRARRNSDGATPMFMAAAHGLLEIVQALIARPDKFQLAQMIDPGAPNLRGDRWGALPISIAAENGHKDVALALQPLTPASKPKLANTAPVFTDDSRIWSFIGHDIRADSTTLQAAAKGGSRKISLDFLGSHVGWFGAEINGIEWDDFVTQVRTNRVAGTCWWLHCHGSKWSAERPRHTVGFADGQEVGTSEVVRILVESGVRKIALWSCYGKLFLKHLDLRIQSDPGWPQMHEVLEVTVTGEETELNAMALDKEDRERVLRDIAHPDEPPTAPRQSVMARTTFRFDPASGKALVRTVPAPDVDEIAARLPQLTPDEQKQLVCSYMTKCCVTGKADELERAITKFPQLADVNYQPPHSAATLLGIACGEGRLEVVELLLERGAKIEWMAGSARTIAMDGGHTDVVKLLDTWKNPRGT